MRSTMKKTILPTIVLLLLAGCGQSALPASSPPSNPSGSSSQVKQPAAQGTTPAPAAAGNPGAKPDASSGSAAKPSAASGSAAASNAGVTDKNAPPAASQNAANPAAAKPESITVLVNKQYPLAEGYAPADLVYPDVPFTFSEKVDKRKMRKEAADALKKLFEGAKKDSIFLAGVSAYRSYATQKTIYTNYVQKDGEEKAKTYSAVPGHSEHETGLAIDLSGSDGKCAAENCFSSTKEAKWLDKHASEYGFIIRYPLGKQSITGYQYEPWHLRYVGTELSKELTDKGLTLEEYYNAVPVSR